MKNRWIIFVFFYLISLSILGQNIVTFRGHTLDSLKKPIDAISVVLYDSTNKIVSFSQTDKTGYYKILHSFDRNRYLYLAAHSLEYTSNQIKVFGNNLDQSIDFTLTPRVFSLKEFTVREKVKIKSSGDTTTFSADSFKNNSEKVLEDLLQKIPGFSVAKNGTISIRGKAIDKILIDGDDLMDSNYRLISRNLSANLIDKIQVIENYVDNPLMRKMVNSEKQVINLTFKNENINSLFGDANLGAGSGKRYDNVVNLLNISKHLKTYNLFSFNTIGKNPKGDAVQNTLTEESNDLFFFPNTPQSEYTNINDINFSEVKEKQINYNNAILLFPNFILKPSKRVLLKFNVNYYKDTNVFKEHTITNFIDSLTSTLVERKSLKQEPKQLSSSVEMISTPSENTRLKYNGKWLNIGLFSEANTTANAISNRQILNSNNDTFQNELSFTKKISNTHVLNGIFFQKKNNYTQNYNLDFSEKRFLPFRKDSLKSLNQFTESLSSFFGGKLQFLTAHKHYKLNYHVGYEKSQEIFSSKFDDKLNSNRFILNSTNISFGVNADINYDNLRFFINLPAYIINYNSNISENTIFVMNPTLRLYYKKENHSFQATYSYNSKVPQVSNISNSIYLSNYRTLQNGADKIHILNNHNIFLAYQYSDLFNQISLFSNFLYTKNINSYNNQVFVNKDYTIQNFIYSNKGNELYNFSIGLDKFLSSIKSTIKFHSEINLFNFQNQFNGLNLRNVRSLSHSYSLNLRSSWKSFINYHLGSELKKNEQFVVDQINFHNIYIDSFIDLNFGFSPKLTCSINAEKYTFPNTINNNLFINSEVKYIVKPNTLSFKISANNLLNNKELTFFSINDYQKAFKTYSLINRYILLEANFRL